MKEEPQAPQGYFTVTYAFCNIFQTDGRVNQGFNITMVHVVCRGISFGRDLCFRAGQ